MQDATRFLLRHYQTLVTWPLQIYSSAIVFSPETSVVRRDNLDKIPAWLIKIPLVEDMWASLIQTLAGHSHWVHAVAFSPDGKRIAYLASPDAPFENSSLPFESHPNQLKVIEFDGGVLLKQFDWPASAGEPRWAPGGEAIDYVLTRNGVSNVWQQNLTGGASKQITNFESGQIFDFDWSRDGRQLALTRGTESSDVVLISNFR